MCGKRPLFAETWSSFNVFEWDINKISGPSSTVFDWSASSTTSRTCRFTDIQVEKYLSDPKTPAKTGRAMRILRTLIPQPNQEAVNQEIAKLDNTRKAELKGLCQDHYNRRNETSWWSPSEDQLFRIEELKLCFEYQLACYYERTTEGRHPELTKPCGRTIAWKNMAPVPVPEEWTTKWERFEKRVDVQDSPIDENLQQHLNSRETPEVQVAVDPRIAEAFRALITLRRWNHSDTCVVKVRDTVRGKFSFPLPEQGPTIPLRALLETSPNFRNTAVESVVNRSRGLYGLSDDEIRIVSLYTTDLFFQSLNYTLHHRKPTAIDIDITGYLLQALKKCPLKPGKVYRGLENFQAASDPTTQYVKGKYVIWVSFTSCSRKLSTASMFTNKATKSPKTLFEIDQVSGVDISALSVIHSEEETLLTPNTVLQVVNVTHKGKLDRVHLKEVPKGEDLLCMMECTASADWPGDETPWATSCAFLPASVVKGTP